MINPKYNWQIIQKYHDSGHGVRSCMRKFGFAGKTWYDAIARGALIPNAAVHGLKHDIQTWLVSDRPQTARCTLKRRLIDEKYLEDRCAICTITEWCDKKLSLHIDHINGIKTDNRITNLRLLCPNCHSQTSTYGGRNRRKIGLKHSEVADVGKSTCLLNKRE